MGRLESKDTERTTYKNSERGTANTQYKTMSNTLNLPNKKPPIASGRNTKNGPLNSKISSRKSSKNGDGLSSSTNELPKFAKLNRTESSNLFSEQIHTASNPSMEPAIITALGNKKKRAEADKSMRWPINEVKSNLVEKLKKTLIPAMNPLVLEYMFLNDNKKTMEVLGALSNSVKSDFELFHDILDLIFKWCTMKLIVQSNTNINKGITDFLLLIFTELYQNHKALQEFESASILPILCEKLGANQSSFRDACRELIKKARDLCPVSKIYGYLMMALDSPNSKTKSEALSMIIELMKAYENQMIIDKDIKTVAKLLDASDNIVKKQVLEYLQEIYNDKKDKFWTLIGSISESNKSMLKQKFEQPKSAKLNDKVKANPYATPRSGKGGFHSRQLSHNKTIRSRKNSPSENESEIASTLLMNKGILGNAKEEDKTSPETEIHINSNIPEKQKVVEKCI